MPFYLFSASASAGEEFYDLGTPGTSKVLTETTVEPSATLDFHGAASTQANPTPGSTEHGEITYSAKATQNGQSFSVDVSASVTYKGGGSGVPYFGIAEIGVVEIDVYARTTFQARRSFEGMLDVDYTKSSGYSHCFTSGFIDGCDVGDGGSAQVSAFNHGVVGGTPIDLSAVQDSYELSTWGLLLNRQEKITAPNGIDYVKIGSVRVQPKFEWAYTFIIGAQEGDFQADGEVEVSASVDGRLKDVPPRIEFVQQFPGFEGLKPEDQDNSEKNDGKNLAEQATTLEPLWLTAVVSKGTGYENSVTFDTSFKAKEELGFDTFELTDGTLNGGCENKVTTYAEENSIDLEGMSIYCSLVFPAKEEYQKENRFTARLQSSREGLSDAAFFTDIKRSEKFPIFFHKLKDDDAEGDAWYAGDSWYHPVDANGNGVPNWFEYWIVDEATSHGKKYVDDVHYLQPTKCSSNLALTTDLKIELGDGATLEYPAFGLVPKILRDASDSKDKFVKKFGVDTLESQLSHELVHRLLNGYRIKRESDPNGVEEYQKPYLIDSDSDYIPDQLERELNRDLGLSPDGPHFDPSEGNSFLNLVKAELQRGLDNGDYGGSLGEGCPPADLLGGLIKTDRGFANGLASDNEVLARLVSYGPIGNEMIDSFVFGTRRDFVKDDKTELHKRDFANPGKQTTPNYSTGFTSGAPNGTNASLNGLVSSTISEDRRHLLVNVGVDVFEKGQYEVRATLEDSAGRLQYAGEIFSFDTGGQAARLSFSGGKIRTGRLDGPFTIRNVSLVGTGIHDVLSEPHETAAYSATDFAHAPGLMVDRVEVVQFVDVDGDENPDRLDVEISVDNHGVVAGDFELMSYLYASGVQAVARANSVFSASTDGSTTLQFELDSAMFSRVEGDLSLGTMLLRNAEGEVIDFIDQLPLSVAIDGSTFAGRDVKVMESVDVQPFDSDGDTIPDRVRFDVPLEVKKLGTYSFHATMATVDGGAIASQTILLEADRSGMEFQVDFDAKPLVEQQLDGPYLLDNLVAYDSNGELVELITFTPASSAIAWGEWTGDRTAPTSAVLNSDAISRLSKVNLEVSAEDDLEGTGVRSYDVFYSTDGGEFKPWVETATAPQFAFEGEYGKTYHFYSVARDHALNLEAFPSQFDAAVTLVSPWRNIVDPFDVDRSGQVTAFDALAVINFLHRNGASGVVVPFVENVDEVDRFLDVSGNGYVSPLDAVRVINQLWRQRAISAEPEHIGSTPVTSLLPLFKPINDHIDEELSDESVVLPEPNQPAMIGLDRSANQQADRSVASVETTVESVDAVFDDGAVLDELDGDFGTPAVTNSL